MDTKLLDRYNQELLYMRELAGEFAREHPKIASRLGMQGIEVADPYVERLIEAFCLMSARMQLKLDAEFPRLTQRLLEVLYPNYVAPTPSMAVAQYHPGDGAGSLVRGYTIARGAKLSSHPLDGIATHCHFRTTQPITLWPVRLTDARLTGVPPDIPALERYLPGRAQVRSALRLRLRTADDVGFDTLQGLDHLPIYLSGAEQTATHLFELLHGSCLATLVAAPGTFGRHPHVIERTPLSMEGFAPEQRALPVPWNAFHGHALLQEYFACPSRFYFFTLKHLAPALSRITGPEVEIVVLLGDARHDLARQVDTNQFALYCAPIVNLFEGRIEKLRIHSERNEAHLVVDASAPLDHEVHSVLSMTAWDAATSRPLEFRPLFQTISSNDHNHGRYYSLRRMPRPASDSTRKYGRRTDYVGSEVFASLVDQHEAPYPQSMESLGVTALLTNRDLPLLLPRNGHSDFVSDGTAPISSIGLVRTPSPPAMPPADGEIAWRLIHLLNFDYRSLQALDHAGGGGGLRDLLRLFAAAPDGAQRRQIDSIVGTHVEGAFQRLPGPGPILYGRGTRCRITVDEAGFSGHSAYLFGAVLEHFLARQASINAFVQTELISMQRGSIGTWQPRTGTRGAC